MTTPMTKLAGYLIPLTLLLFIAPSYAQTHAQKVEELLAQTQAPTGVVFEVATANQDGLDWALPLIKDYIVRLRNKFPGIEIAVVSHGSELAALTQGEAAKRPKIHSITQQLNKDGVQLHVCGTLAGWRGISQEDFPDYVNVSTSGPAQVNDYRAVGYTLIKLRAAR